MFDVDQQRRQAQSHRYMRELQELLGSCLRKAGEEGSGRRSSRERLCHHRYIHRVSQGAVDYPGLSSSLPHLHTLTVLALVLGGELTLPSSQQPSSSAGGPLPPTLSPIKSSKGAIGEARRPTAESKLPACLLIRVGQGVR